MTLQIQLILCADAVLKQKQQVLSSWENQTVLQYFKQHRKKCFTFNRIFLRTKNGIFWRSNQQRDLLLLLSGKRKTVYTIFEAIRFYYGGNKDHPFCRISATMKKNLKKSDVVKHEFQVTSYQMRVESLKARVEIKKCDFKSTSHEFKFTNSRIF